MQVIQWTKVDRVKLARLEFHPFLEKETLQAFDLS